MASSLDMSLDDLIKNSKATSARGSGNQSGRGRGRGGARRGRGRNYDNRNGSNNNSYSSNNNNNNNSSNGGSSGPIRRNSARSAPLPTPYSKPILRNPDGQWDHDMFEEDAGASLKPNTGIETGTKLFISNLDFGVSNEDIKELFSEIGDLKRCTVHYDRSGRSKGTAEVVFSRRADAVTATKRYNNVQLDGNPMKIEIIGTNLQTPVTSNKVSSEPPLAGKFGPGPVEMSSRGRGGSYKKGRGRGRGRGSEKIEKSAADLDAELEDYHAEAMQVS